MAASFTRRLGAMCYDGLILLAIYLLFTFILLIIKETLFPHIPKTQNLELSQNVAFSPGNWLYQFSLIFISFFYFQWFWRKKRQTTGMLAWKIIILDMHDQPISFKQAFIRFFVALISNALFLIGLLWSIVDKEGCTLYDRVSKTRLKKVS